MNREIMIGIEKLIAMFVIAKGYQAASSFLYEPKLPKPLTENVRIGKEICNFGCLRVNLDFEVECWFINKDNKVFYSPLKEVKKSQPLLYVCIFTHIFDMIENIDM
jgi:hypothetical protein